MGKVKVRVKNRKELMKLDGIPEWLLSISGKTFIGDICTDGSFYNNEHLMSSSVFDILEDSNGTVYNLDRLEKDEVTPTTDTLEVLVESPLETQVAESPLYTQVANPIETQIANPLDNQIGGDHYKTMQIQPIDFIYKNNLNFLQGNIIKYTCRYKAKNGKEDLLKARHYLDLLIKLEYEK